MTFIPPSRENALATAKASITSLIVATLDDQMTNAPARAAHAMIALTGHQ
jgi:hypothetical protein